MYGHIFVLPAGSLQLQTYAAMLQAIFKQLKEQAIKGCFTVSCLFWMFILLTSRTVNPLPAHFFFKECTAKLYFKRAICIKIRQAYPRLPGVVSCSKSGVIIFWSSSVVIDSVIALKTIRKVECHPNGSDTNNLHRFHHSHLRLSNYLIPSNQKGCKICRQICLRIH